VTITVDCVNGRSIKIQTIDAAIDDLGNLVGTFTITDESEDGSGNRFDVQITTLGVTLEKKQGKNWVMMDTSCAFDPAAPVVFSDQIAIAYSCAPAATGTVRVTAEVEIAGHDKLFILRGSFTLR
jgi:hypothetical protein